MRFVRVKVFMRDPAKRTPANTAEDYQEGRDALLMASACVD
jgi:hypothetical protein